MANTVSCRRTTGTASSAGPAWGRVETSDGPPSWYLHLFAAEQPDLDWTNPEVRAEFLDILRWWLDRGVDGFRIDVAHGLAKDPELPDLEGEFATAGLALVGHPHWDRDDVHEIYRDWRRVADEYPGDRVFVAEAYLKSPERLARYVRSDELHTAFNFRFLMAPWETAALREAIEDTLHAHDAVGAPATWVLSNHDVVREVTRYGGGEIGTRRARAAALLMLALPGSAYVYQGEELGLPEVEELPGELRQDPTYLRTAGVDPGRDGCRVPLPWEGDSPPFGFSRAAAEKVWLPQPPEWSTLTREHQRSDPDSMLRLYGEAIRRRRSIVRAAPGSELRWLDLGADVIAFERPGGNVSVTNLGATAVPLDDVLRLRRRLLQRPDVVAPHPAAERHHGLDPRRSLTSAPTRDVMVVTSRGVSLSGSLRSVRRPWVIAVLAVAVAALGACSSEDDGGSVALTWYINPDNGGQRTLAAECSDASEGAYRITTQILPNEADAQREQLVRRLAAGDTSVDLMSLDPPFVAEFANAGYLEPITDEQDVADLTEGVLEGPLETASWDGQLVATPFWANTQLLWFRKSVAAAAGVDPTAEDFTWAQMIDAAESQQKRIGVQARRYEGYMVWINSLVSSGGGEIVTDTEAGVDAVPSMASPAGDAAADVVGRLARSSAAPGDMATAGEEESRSLFQGDSGSFMVNWPYVYGAAKAAVEDGSLDPAVFEDIGWARYPRVDAGRPSSPPLGGINLAIGAFSEHPDEALDAVKCITSVENNAQYMVESGNSAARSGAYDDPEVRETFPMADLIRESINDAAPRPITPYYGDVSTSVQRTWHPATSVRAPRTPERTDTYMYEVLHGERLL